jgi:hypothetical protein
VEIQELHGVAKQHNALLVLHGASGIDVELIKVMLSRHCLLCNHKKKSTQDREVPTTKNINGLYGYEFVGAKGCG